MEENLRAKEKELDERTKKLKKVEKPPVETAKKEQKNKVKEKSPEIASEKIETAKENQNSSDWIQAPYDAEKEMEELGGRFLKDANSEHMDFK